MKTPEVRIATRADEDSAVSAMVLAFVRDPVTRWAYPDPRQYLTHVPPFFRAFGGTAFAHHTAHVTDSCSGAALWLPPGVAPDDDALDAIFERSLSPRKYQTLARIFEEMAHCHPTEPHWYLALIGVDPNEQGRGLGTALLRAGLERVDREHLPAYLENTNPANTRFYERHGFQAVGMIQVDDAPPLVPMIRVKAKR